MRLRVGAEHHGLLRRDKLVVELQRAQRALHLDGRRRAIDLELQRLREDVEQLLRPVFPVARGRERICVMSGRVARWGPCADLVQRGRGLVIWCVVEVSNPERRREGEAARQRRTSRR